MFRKPLNNAWQRKWLAMECTSPEIQEMADAIQAYAKSFFGCAKRGKHLIICGETGTGKTHVAERLFEWMKRQSIPAWEYGNWGHPPRIEMYEWAKIVSLDPSEFRAWLADRSSDQMNVDCLLIEDIGAEVDKFKSGEPTERLRELLNDFKGKWLVFTSNVMPEQWNTKWDARIADRLLRNSKLIILRETTSYVNHRKINP